MSDDAKNRGTSDDQVGAQATPVRKPANPVWVLKDSGHYLSFVSETGALDEYVPQQKMAHWFFTKEKAIEARNAPGRREQGLTLVRLAEGLPSWEQRLHLEDDLEHVSLFYRELVATVLHGDWKAKVDLSPGASDGVRAMAVALAAWRSTNSATTVRCEKCGVVPDDHNRTGYCEGAPDGHMPTHSFTEITDGDVRGSGAARRDDASSVAGVGDEGRPVGAAHPGAGDDAGARAGGAGVVRGYRYHPEGLAVGSSDAKPLAPSAQFPFGLDATNAALIRCAQCGSHDAPYVENRCMFHVGGQTERSTDYDQDAREAKRLAALRRDADRSPPSDYPIPLTVEKNGHVRGGGVEERILLRIEVPIGHAQRAIDAIEALARPAPKRTPTSEMTPEEIVYARGLGQLVVDKYGLGSVPSDWLEQWRKTTPKRSDGQ